MTPRETFDDALSTAIDTIQRGGSLRDALASSPRHAPEMRPMLEAALAAGVRVQPSAPHSRRLTHNYALVQAALEREQRAARRRSAEPEQRGFWGRRLRFASLSLPVGAVVLLGVASVTSAAAAVLTQTDLPATLADVVTPGWADDFVPGGNSRGNGSGPSPASSGANGGPAGAEGASPTPNPGDLNRPTLLTLGGLVEGANGNRFNLISSDGAWNVNIDDRTIVTGVIADGATVEVTGDVTAERNMHASAVLVTAAAPADAGDPDRGGEQGNDPPVDPPQPTTSPDDKTPPGPPETTGTPGPPEKTKTPSPPDDPGQPGEPPGPVGTHGNE